MPYIYSLYDQSNLQNREPTLMGNTTPGPAGMYPTAQGTPTAVVPVAYPPAAAYTGAPIYQSPVMYTTAEQYPPNNGKMHQYPIPYPMGYYSVNGM